MPVACAAVDTSPFIYLFEGSDHRTGRAVELFRSLAAWRTITSVITPVEVLTHCKREEEEELAARYIEFFKSTPGLAVMPVDWDVALQAATLRATYRMRVPDAIQAATAIVHGADVFITNDRRLTKVTEVKVVLFDEWTP